MIPREMVTLMERRRLVAEVRTETAIQALGVVDALAAAGISTIEISLTIPGANEILTHCAIRRDVLVGAGAVLDTRQATEAISCGARFIASPILESDLIPICRDANVACILGALTPTEIIAAQRAGAEMVKVFPAEALGGPMYVRALLRQLTHVSLQVSGGFTAENMSEYIQLPIRTLALGTLLVPRVLVERGNWQAITNRARAFVEFAANPQANAARFLAMMGVAPQQPVPMHPMYAGQPPQGYPAASAIPGMAPGGMVVPPPVPDNVPPPPLPPDPVRAAVAAVPTMAIPPNAAAIVAKNLPPQRERASGSLDPAASSSNFKPWDSRPVELGDDEDWLR
ncbi:MAG TPA: bifunctional 4-hydroxy-2-oxoglutarate aldolase/2-dehydro-3-deoxy-phosphogluconate aldolase [Ktedonobacterales bacterium]|nr:bifunctional 4-hydroxy-2-oxoglutarate aldolase/2-dehydro-3-deoxy-phosphogluconate aldolase [Ktedonobacterales bacterium]